MTSNFSPVEERERHRRDIALEIARAKRSITGVETEMKYYERCLVIERDYLIQLEKFAEEEKDEQKASN